MKPTANSRFAAPAIRIAASLALLGAVALPAALSDGAALAQTSIEVVVNDFAITSYDIDNRTRFLKLTSRGQLGKKQAIDELIDEQLKFQEAKRRNINVHDAEVDSAYARIASSAKLTPAKLTGALKQQGINPATLKNRIRADIAWSRIVRADARGALNVTEEDVSRALGVESDSGQSKGGTEIAEYTLQQILFVIPAKSSNAYIAQRKREAEGFRGRLNGCDQSQAMAKGLRDVVVRPLIRSNEQDLANFADTVAATPIGKATQPRKIDKGYELVAVCGKKMIPGKNKVNSKLRNEIVREKGERFARQKLRDLKSEAMIEYR